MMERPPKLKKATKALVDFIFSSEAQALIDKINREYLYWDKAKYKKPDNIDDAIFWTGVKYSRIGKRLQFHDYFFSFKETTNMQQLLHEFDMNFGGSIISSNTFGEGNRTYYLLSSLMEEAIASSQMEGASTTREIAKDMLRKNKKPKDISQKMIQNNYNTILFLSEKKGDKLSPELILEIHGRITEDTLEKKEYEGCFRNNNDIVVQDAVTGEIAHRPPDFKQIPLFIDDLCNFANDNENFIHPIIKAIILHFMISFLHPFTDGNGRTARSIFYWYMLKNDYRLMEFMSISRIIYRSKAQYEKAFLYTEIDDNDLGYFIHYNLVTLKKSYMELLAYLKRKQEENNALFEFRDVSNLNSRQARILKMYSDKPDSVLTARDMDYVFGISARTARGDLESLVERGFLVRVAENKRLRSYVRSKDFDLKLEEIRGK